MLHEKQSVDSILASLVSMVAVTILRGLALSILWGWFIVPLGTPVLSVAQAVGIILIVDVLIIFPSTEKSEIEDRKWYIPARNILIGIVTLWLLFFGWIAHLFM